jgi:hypothetical protein
MSKRAWALLRLLGSHLQEWTAAGVVANELAAELGLPKVAIGGRDNGPMTEPELALMRAHIADMRQSIGDAP